MFLVIRVRGRTGINKDIADTLKMLRLNRINHAVLLEENDTYKGMLQKAKDYITWGEVDSETVANMISKRGEFLGKVKITEENLKEDTDFKSISDLAEALMDDNVKYDDINMKPIFRLNPPRKGYEAIRLSFNEGGTLGYRGELINELVNKMA